MKSHQFYGRDALMVCALVVCCACATTRTASHVASIPPSSVDDLTGVRNNHDLAAIVGTVVDSASGSPLEAVRIVVVSEDDAEMRMAFSDRLGGFLLPQLKPARYKLVTQREGYGPHMEWRTARAGSIDTVRARMPLRSLRGY